MGLLSKFAPSIERIIHDFTTPIEETERLFGTIITDIKAAAKDLVGLLNSLEHLLSSDNLLAATEKPFEAAIMDALSGITTLQKLVFKAGKTGFEDMTTVLRQPVADAYGLVRKGIAELRDEYNQIVNSIQPQVTRVIDDSLRDVHIAIERMEDDTALIKQQLASNFQVVFNEERLFKQEFVQFTSNARTEFSADINRSGTILVDDFSALKTQMQNHFGNTSSAIDAILHMFVTALILAIVVAVISLRSKSIVIFTLLILALGAIAYFLL
jgi:hypothetical protein